jgi:lipid-A-disaccharide synthase
MTNTRSHPLLWVTAAGTSADRYAALLLTEMKRINTALCFAGGGGPALIQAGMEADISATEIAGSGLGDFLSNILGTVGVHGALERAMRRRIPLAAICVGESALTLRTARLAHGMGVPAGLYMGPELWAKPEADVAFLKKYARRVLCAFPFEPRWYREQGLEVEFVGHPLLDAMDMDKMTRLRSKRNRVGLLPGSDENDIQARLPLLAQTARLLKKSDPGTEFILVRAPGVEESLAASLWPKDAPPIVLHAPDHRHEHMRSCGLLLAGPGTATLESALMGTPTVVVAPETEKNNVPGCVANLIFEEQVFPELIGETAKPENVADHARLWLRNETPWRATRAKLALLREMLGGPGASLRAARLILGTLGLEGRGLSAASTLRPRPRLVR